MTYEEALDKICLEKHNHYWIMNHRRNVGQIIEIMTEAAELYTSSIRSELAEKDKRLQVMLKYESDRDLFIFEQQTKIEKLGLELAEKEKKVEEWITNWNHLDKMYTHQKAAYEAADKVIELYTKIFTFRSREYPEIKEVMGTLPPIKEYKAITTIKKGEI